MPRLWSAGESSGVLVKMQIPEPEHEDSDSIGWGGALESAFSSAILTQGSSGTR